MSYETINPLTKVRKLIRNPVRRSRIVHLTHLEFGVDTAVSRSIIAASDETRDLNRGKKRKNGEARICHERDMFVIMMQHVKRIDPEIALSIFYHDRYEENPRKWPLYRIEEEAGSEVRKIVSAVSKPQMTDSELVSSDGSRLIDAKIRAGGEKAMIIKSVDRFHYFLKPFPHQDRRRLIWKVVQTMQYIQQMALEVGVLTIELELIVADSIRRNRITTLELMEFV